MVKTLNVGIFAHIDAGKTSLTERLLYLSGAIRSEGSVDGGTSCTDFLTVERRRGISVRDACARFTLGDTIVNIIDTPGHADFAEETSLALTAVDMAILVVSAVEGVQAQTESLLSAMKKRSVPILLFINKCDRKGATPEAVVKKLSALLDGNVIDLNKPSGEEDAFKAIPYELFEEDAVTTVGDEDLLERYLFGADVETELHNKLQEAFSTHKLFPVLYGSAKLGEGCKDVLTALNYFSFERKTAPFSAFVYQVEHRKSFGTVAHVRLFGGSVSVREEVFNRRTEKTEKVSQIKSIQGDKYHDVATLSNGEVGAIVGLQDVVAGDFLGAEPTVKACPLPTPFLRIRVTPDDPEKLIPLKDALSELSEESPSLALEWIPEKRELNVNTSGTVHTEVLRELLLERYGLKAETSAPSVIYRETPTRSGFGFECYTMPKPCWAVVKFYVEPMPRGTGLIYECTVSEKKIAYRYQEHVKTAVPRALKQGIKGWEVTDLKVVLVDGEDHPQHTHPLDFFTATPMGLMDGLRNCGTTLLEPVLRITVNAPDQYTGKLLSELYPRRAHTYPPETDGERVKVVTDIPVSEAMDLSERIPSLTGGRAIMEQNLLGYFPCPEGVGETRERVGVDPLDRAKWILHARGAL